MLSCKRRTVRGTSETTGQCVTVGTRTSRITNVLRLYARRPRSLDSPPLSCTMPNPLSTRPTKRSRVSDESQDTDSSTTSSTSTNLKLQRHAEFWFRDGNIVLVAKHTGFRIYRGLLSSQSTVFSDMFASSTSNVDETFDGCPVVHLSDSPHDLVHLLHVLIPKTRIQ